MNSNHIIKPTSLLDVYAPENFSSYDEFVKDFKIRTPENFNFGFDVVDKMAKKAPLQTALVWCDDKGAEAVFNFKQMMEQSNKAANALTAMGIKKGDVVMLILKRRYEFWFISNALGFTLVFLGFVNPALAAFYNFVADFFPLLNSSRLFKD